MSSCVKFSFSLSDVLGNLVEGQPKQAKGRKKPADFKCPRCGMRFSEFRNKARLGCSHDYEIFKNALVPLLEKIHGGVQHVGKTPKTVDEQVQKENELMRLKRELDTHVKSENFEKAAEARDRIKTLESELTQEG